jgi:hypothetical protein
VVALPAAVYHSDGSVPGENSSTLPVYGSIGPVAVAFLLRVILRAARGEQVMTSEDLAVALFIQ